MARLLIIADVHGLYNNWAHVIKILQPTDTLIIAGDLFGNKYAHHNDPNYRPADIRREFQELCHNKHYVYGNCDLPQFLPGYATTESFSWNKKNILLTHGHLAYDPSGYEVIITGHSHIPTIQTHQNILYLNPGSISQPRHIDQQKTYIIWDENFQPGIIPLLKI